MGRRRQDLAVRAAMIGGVLVGLWLLSQLAPGPDEVQVSPQQVVTPKVKPAAPVLPRRTKPKAPAAQPVLEPAAEDEAQTEPVDTADDNVVVTLVLEDADGYAVDGGWPYVTGCEIQHHYRTESNDYAVVVPYGSICEAWAQKQDGLLPVRTDTIEFDAMPGTEIVLVFPAERTGGIGIRFQPMGDHVVVVDVLPGTPAWEAGLVNGDRIISVGGVAVADLDTEGFVDEMTGPEGSDVEFELELDGDTGLSISSVSLRRAFLSG